MIPVPSDVEIWIAMGRTDMRRGMRGLALQVQQTLKRDLHAGDIYLFRRAIVGEENVTGLPRPVTGWRPTLPRLRREARGGR